MTAASPLIDALPHDRLIMEFSLWSADLLRIADDLARIDSHADILHVDVADGHFTPSVLFFPTLTEAIRKQSARPIHVHLMVADSILLAQVEQFADVGADIITIHAENRSVRDEALDLIEQRGLVAGLALTLDTPVAEVAPLLPRLGFVTLMGTAIGIKGAGLDPNASARISEAKALLARESPKRRIILASDGGNREDTVPQLRAAGADTVVLGSLAFGAPSLDERMAWLRGL